MSDFANFRPKTVEVLVGEKPLIVKEFVAAKRDAVVKVFLEGLNIANLLKPFSDTIKQIKSIGDAVDAAEVAIDLADIADQLKHLVLKIFSEELTQIGCITLDILENRQRIEGIKADDKLSVNDKHGYEYNKEFFAWVANNLTLRQEQQLIGAIIEVNDIASLVKNYWTLVLQTMKKGKGNEKNSKDPKELK